MDTAKLRLLAAVTGLLMGLGAILTLFVATTLALAQVMGLIPASFTVAAGGLVLAGLCLFFFLKPFRSIEEEVDEVEEVTAEALADLPFDAIRSIVQRRPLTATAIAMVLGYMLVRNPQAAQRQVERFILSML